ncbi:MAG: hypothetical protein ACXW1Z_19060 [Methylobacter sp.]
MNQKDSEVLLAMAYRQKQMYDSITTAAVFIFLYAVFGREAFMVICLGLVTLVVLAIVIRFVVSRVRRLGAASEAIRDKLYKLFNLNVLFGCLAVYFMGSVIIYTIYEGVEFLLGIPG